MRLHKNCSHCNSELQDYRRNKTGLCLTCYRSTKGSANKYYVGTYNRNIEDTAEDVKDEAVEEFLMDCLGYDEFMIEELKEDKYYESLIYTLDEPQLEEFFKYKGIMIQE